MSKKVVTRLSAEVDDRLYIAGITRKELANTIGMHPTTLSSILTGRIQPSVRASRAIAEEIGMDEKQLRRIALETIKEQRRAI